MKLRPREIKKGGTRELLGPKKVPAIPSQFKEVPRTLEQLKGDKKRILFCKPYAVDALNYYNQRAGTNYVFLEDEILATRSWPLATCLVSQFNFVAQNKDVNDAPLEMFFAEFTTKRSKRTLQMSVNLGPTDSLPEPSTHGCRLCTTPGSIRHPKVAGWSKTYV